MIVLQDTIVHQNQQPVVEEPVEVLNAASSVDSASVPQSPRHPYQVLRQLPADATPAQQDSAIQATFHPEIKHISAQPDTLHLPGHDVGKSAKDVNIPQYYRENFFSKDPLYHPEINGGRYGMAGDPMPYSIRHDDVITGLLLGCFILVMIAFSRIGHFMLRQIKDFFYIPRSELTTEVSETTGEFRFQFFLVIHTCVICALMCFFYVQENIAQTFILKSPYHLIGLFAAIFLVYYLIKALLYTIVNQIFFGGKKNRQWLKSQLFIIAMMGIVLLPLVLLLSYFDLTIHNAIIYALVVLILVKILSFYKCYVIFFRGNALSLQFILYLCALEIVPIFLLFEVLRIVIDYLKINF
ncbi:MAG: DUF4271 domain-containing protein [Prevotella sp.]|nr:DUF4271 domain-containing protein [Prevotella sp.]